MKWCPREWWYLVAPALLAVLVYLPTVRYQFVWDDVNLVVYSKSGLFTSFGQSFWHDSKTHLGEDPYYRPWVNFTLKLERQLFGLKPGWFHLSNVLLHGAVTFLVALLFFWLVKSSLLAGVAGFFFGLHPLFVDSVAYISGRTDLWASFGVVIAALAGYRYLEKVDGKALLLAAVGFAIAVFSKENAVLFIAVAGLGVVTHSVRKRARWWLLITLAGVLVIYFGARFFVLKSFLGVRAPANLSSIGLFTLNSFGRQLTFFLFPFRTPLFWGQFTPGNRLVVTGILGLGWLLVPLVVRKIKFSRLLFLAWLWVTVTLLPFAWSIQFGPTGRLLYLPGIGMALFLTIVLENFRETKPKLGRILTGLVLLWCVAGLPVLFKRLSYWRDEFPLFFRMVEEMPGYAPGYYNLGTAMLAKGDTSSAISFFSRAVVLDSEAVGAALNLGALLQKGGRFNEAEELYRQIIRRRPDYAPAYVNLGLLLYREGKIRQAIGMLKDACALAPDDGVAFYNLSQLYWINKQADSALWAIESACQLMPENQRFREFWRKISR
ncbi:tetratricopeptide repeat protein [candidate division WOR-3 bacterium]|nr:tetratricopeptide repeat protein [candidate division WOR-3 bacterium]